MSRLRSTCWMKKELFLNKLESSSETNKDEINSKDIFSDIITVPKIFKMNSQEIQPKIPKHMVIIKYIHQGIQM